MGADWRKPRIVFEHHRPCQTKSGKQRIADKKNATQSSRVKSTPKEEGGGDKPELHIKSLLSNAVPTLCILRHQKINGKIFLCGATYV